MILYIFIMAYATNNISWFGGEKKHCVSSKLTALNKYVLIQKQKDDG